MTECVAVSSEGCTNFNDIVDVYNELEEGSQTAPS